MNRSVFRFGNSSIDIASRELKRESRRIDLAPPVFDCIAYLIQHRERAVGRDELVAAVWGKTSVSDAVMGKTILTARRAIGDTAEEQRFLRTVPRFGYQWVAETSVESEVQASPPPIDRVATTTVSGTTTRLARIGVAAAIAALLAFAIVLFERRHATTTPESAALAHHTTEGPVEITVVLPAEVLASGGDAWLRLGLMDLVATRLRAAGLAVMPSDNVVRLVPADTTRDAALAAVRGVAARSRVVVPVVRCADNAWIVRAELIDADGQEHAVQAEDGNAIVAASAVADQVLDLLGKRSADAPRSAAQLSQAELLQRVDAARLAGDPAEARALIAAASEDLRNAPEVELRIAQIDLRTGEFDAAEHRLADLAKRVTPESDATLHARVQSYLCIALARVGRMDEAVHACDAAIAIFENRDEPAELGRVYSDRGIVHTLTQQHDLAARDFARARIALDLAGDALQLAKVEGNESVLETSQGHYAEAVAIEQRIGERFARFGMNNERVVALDNETGAHLALLQPLEALASSDRALALIDRVTDASIRHLTKIERAEALARNGRIGEARVLFDEVIADSGEAQQAADRAVARAGEAQLALAGGRAADALLLARQALPDLPAPPYADTRASAWLCAVRSLHALGRNDEAGEETKAFTAWAATIDEPLVRLYARIAAAEHAVAMRDPAAARLIYDEALSIAQRWNVPDALSETVRSYARQRLAEGDADQASTLTGLVARYAAVDFDIALLQARLYLALGRNDAAQSAIATARRLAGEREIPADLASPPPPLRSG